MKFIKKSFHWSDQEVSSYLGVSRSQITKINAGYWEGLSSETVKRISQLVRISVDELLDVSFLPPSYHISKHIYSAYIKADKDMPDFSIKEGDFLYIRPFVHDDTKFNQLVLVYTQSGYDVEQYTRDSFKKVVHFHVVGMTRFMYKPIEDIDYQEKIGNPSKSQEVSKVRRGAPIKF